MKGRWYQDQADQRREVHVVSIGVDQADPGQMHVRFDRLGSISLDVRYLSSAGELRRACLEFADVVVVGLPEGHAAYVHWLVSLLATPAVLADPVESQAVVECVGRWLPLCTREIVGGCGFGW